MLEQKIEALTASIERLIAVLEKQPTTAPTTAPATEVTKDILQAWALGKVRDGDDKTFKQRLMAELQLHGVKTIAALKDDSAAREVFDAMGGRL